MICEAPRSRIRGIEVRERGLKRKADELEAREGWVRAREVKVRKREEVVGLREEAVRMEDGHTRREARRGNFGMGTRTVRHTDGEAHKFWRKTSQDGLWKVTGTRG